MGSKTFDGVRFAAYTKDHWPPHVHGFYAGVEVIVDLLVDSAAVSLSSRKDRVQPRNAKQSDVKRVLRAARVHYAELKTLWEEA